MSEEVCDINHSQTSQIFDFDRKVPRITIRHQFVPLESPRDSVTYERPHQFSSSERQSFRRIGVKGLQNQLSAGAQPSKQMNNPVQDVSTISEYNRQKKAFRTKFAWQQGYKTEFWNSKVLDLGQQVSFKDIESDDVVDNDVLGSQSPKKNGYILQIKERMRRIWRIRGLAIIHIVSKFIQQLKTNTDKLKYRLINEKVFNIIGDYSSDYYTTEQWRKSLKKTEIVVQFNRIIQAFLYIFLPYLKYFKKFISAKVTVLYPDSTFKLLWDTLVVTITIINIFYIPMKLSFDVDKRDNPATVFLLETLPSYVFIIEILLNFNSAYYHKGTIHTNRKEIFKHYLSNGFVLDLIVVVPFIVSQFDVPYTDFTLLLRVTRIKSMVEQLELVLNMPENYQAIFDLVKLVYFMIFLSHFSACAWHLLAVTEVNEWNTTTSWLIENNLINSYWTSRYIASIYWSTITIITVGYGDITPTTEYERVFVIFVALIICGAFGYSISAIGQILQRLEEKKALNKIKLKIINIYVKKRGLSKALQLKVRKYFEYYFQIEEEEEQFKADQLMSQMTRRLREEVVVDIYLKILKRSRLLGNNFSDDILNRLCLLLKEKKYAPEEEIFSQGEVASKLLFVLSGELQVQVQAGFSDNNQTKILRNFKQGFVIGEREFATNRMYDYSARAVKFTSIAFLDYEEYLKVLKEFPKEYEKFCFIRDNLIYNQGYKILGKVCEICQSTHQFQKCPFVFYQPNQNKLSARFRINPAQPRVQYKRTNNRSNIFSSIDDIQEAVLGFIVKNNMVSEEWLSDDYLAQLGFNLKDQLLITTQSIPESKQAIQDIIQKNLNENSSNQIQNNQICHKCSEVKIGTDRDVRIQKRSNALINIRTKNKSLYKKPSLLMVAEDRQKSHRLINQHRSLVNQNSMMGIQNLGSGLSSEGGFHERQTEGKSLLELSLKFTDKKLIEKKFLNKEQSRMLNKKFSSSFDDTYTADLKKQVRKTLGEKYSLENSSLKIQREYMSMDPLQRGRSNDYSKKEQEETKHSERSVKHSEYLIQKQDQQRIDYCIDRQYSSEIYFPMYNLEVILKKLDTPYLSVRELRKIKSHRPSQSPFDRIRVIQQRNK